MISCTLALEGLVPVQRQGERGILWPVLHAVAIRRIALVVVAEPIGQANGLEVCSESDIVVPVEVSNIDEVMARLTWRIYTSTPRARCAKGW